MAEIHSFPNNVDEFTGAEPLMRWFHGRPSGIWPEENNGAVTAVEGAMKVTISDAVGWMSNSEGDGIAWWIDTKARTGSPLTLSVDIADNALNRIDRVVVTWDTTNYAKLPTASILKGTPAGNAKPPALTNNKLKRQISLAQLIIDAGTIKLTPDKIKDERLDPEVCGLVVEGVKADTGMINAQFNELIKELKIQIEQAVKGAIPDNSISASQIQKGAVSNTYVANLPVSGWTASGEIVKCTVNIEGISAQNTVIVDINGSGQNSDVLLSMNEAWAALLRVEVKNNQLIFTAETAPEVALAVKVLEVKK